MNNFQLFHPHVYKQQIARNDWHWGQKKGEHDAPFDYLKCTRISNGVVNVIELGWSPYLR